MRIMGLDLGSKTVGVAVSDPLLNVAREVEIIRRKEENKLRQTLARIEELIVEYDVKEIVLGLPLNLDGTEGERAELSREFKDKLERRTGLPVHMWDERLTTVEAIEIMDADGIKPKDREKYVDMIAARVILEGYMEFADKQQ
jgi:putative Holliday junction resolvase